MGEGGERSEATLAELLDGVEELFGERAALGLLPVPVTQELTEGMHLLVDRDEGGVCGEEFLASLSLSLREGSAETGVREQQIGHRDKPRKGLQSRFAAHQPNR